MNTARHIIIDTETLGRRNDAAVTQVGIAIADENFDVLDSYLIQVTPDAWNTCDRTFTGETLLWWIEQLSPKEWTQVRVLLGVHKQKKTYGSREQ